jgi:hypothetical protein
MAQLENAPGLEIIAFRAGGRLLPVRLLPGV